MKYISVCIPTYEMSNLGHIFLKQSFNILSKQTFRDFDIVVSDHSKNDLIEKLCNEYKNKLDIHYYKNNNNIGNFSPNLNNTIKKSGGKLIKILLQDDFLYNEKSLENIVKNFDLEKDTWLITPCIHSKNRVNYFKTFYPKYNKNIYLGKNTIGSPSVLTIKNETPLLFDENLIWLNDCDYYKRYYDLFGQPKIIDTVNVVIGIGDHQVTNTLATKLLREKEYKYIVKKYNKSNLLYFWYSIKQFIKDKFIKK